MENTTIFLQEHTHSFEVLSFSNLYGTDKTFATIQFNMPNLGASQIKLVAIADGHVVTVWMHMGTSMVSWCKRPAVTPEVAAKIKARGFKLGIWILADDEEMARALAFGADVVETTGGIKP